MGLLTDEDEALKWYREAAKSGSGYAQIELAEAYESCLLGLNMNFGIALMLY